MKLSREDAKLVAAFRRSPYAASLRLILERELEAGREKYERNIASEGTRGYILGVRAVTDILFNEKTVISP